MIFVIKNPVDFVNPVTHIIIFSSQKNFGASYDSGHEDMDEDDPNDHDFPHVSLFSVAMMMRKKVYDYINLQHYIRYVKHLHLMLR